MKKSANLHILFSALALVLAGCSNNGATTTESSSSSSSSSSSGGSYACSSYNYFSDPTSCQTSTNKSCTAVNLGYPSYLTCYYALGSSSSSSGSGTCEWQVSDWGTCDSNALTQTRVVSCLCASCTGTKPATSRECSPNLYGGNHSEEDCESLAVMTNNYLVNYNTAIYSLGKAVSITRNNSTIRVCKTPVFWNTMDTTWPSCPSGWTRVSENNIPFNATFARSAQHKDCWTCGFTYKTTKQHLDLMPLARESVDVCTSRNISGCRNWDTVRAFVTHIGCY